MRKKRLFKIFAISLASLIAVALVLYLARRWFFESMIVAEIQAAVRAELGAEIEIEAIRGNWLTEVRVEGVTLRGGPESAYRRVEGLQIEARISPFDLAAGDLGGLHEVRVRVERVELDLERAFAVPSSAPPAAAQGPSLAEILGMLDDGASVEIEELRLHPGWIAPGGLRLTLDAGTGPRQLRLVSGENEIEAILKVNKIQNRVAVAGV